MASYLYRPTPVVNLGNGAFAAPRSFSPGSSMQGAVLGWNYSPGLGRARAAHTPREPYIRRSGTMGSFMPFGMGGLGQDGTDVPIDTTSYVPSTVLTPPTPDQVTTLPTDFLPSLPAPIPVDTSMYTPPNVLVPPAGAGPTGSGIPGTQSLANLQPSVPPSGIAAAVSSVTGAIKNLFAPSTPAVPAGYKQLPGYGGAVAAPAASVLPGISNTLLIGAVLLLGVAVAIGGKK